MQPHIIFRGSKGVVSQPIKHGGKLFMVDGKQIDFRKLIGGPFYMTV